MKTKEELRGIRLEICRLLDVCRICPWNGYEDRMETMENCLQCPTYYEIRENGKQLETGRRDALVKAGRRSEWYGEEAQAILAKGKMMSFDDIAKLLQLGVNRGDIGKILDLDRKATTQYFKVFDNYRKTLGLETAQQLFRRRDF